MNIGESVEICNSSAALNVPHSDIYTAILISAVLLQFVLVRAVSKSINAFNSIKRQSLAAKRQSISISDKTKALGHHHHGPDQGHHLHTQALSMLDFDDLTWSEKLRFFNVWFIILSVGNTCAIIGIVARLALTNFAPFELLLAIAALLIWASLVQYLESFTAFYSLVHTFRAATPQLLRFVLGVVPLFVAYVLFGIAYFGEVTESFGSIDRATNSLFSMLNGDALHDFFDALAPRDLVVSRIYLYSFISLFIYTVFNMFLSIVTQAFALNKLLSPISLDSHTNQAAADLELKVRNHRFHVHMPHGVEATVVPDRIDQMVAAVDASLASLSNGAPDDSANASNRKVSFYDESANGSDLGAGASAADRLDKRVSASSTSGAGVGGHRSSLRAATSQLPTEDVFALPHHGHEPAAVDRLQFSGAAGESSTRAYLIDVLLQQPPLEVVMAEAEAGVDFDCSSDDEQDDNVSIGLPENKRRSSSRALHAVPLLAAPQRSSLTTLLDGIANTSALAPLSPSASTAWRAKHVPSDEFSSSLSMTPPQASALSMSLLAHEAQAADARSEEFVVPAAPIAMDLREPHSISDLLQSIGAMQRACAHSVARGVRTGVASFFQQQQQISQIGASPAACQPRLQAPHDAECYPCGFADCLDCRLRALHERAFGDMKREIEELARHFFAMPANPL